MSQIQVDLNDFHWMLEMIQNIDVGLVVLDKQYRIQTWNTFMEAHSNLRPDQTQGKNIFELFPMLPETWLRNKVDSVFMLNNRSFTTWEQRPQVFKFRNYRPITGMVEYMYQNMTIIPLKSLTGEVTHVSLIIYDVTDVAVNKLQLERANKQLSEISRTDGLTQLNNRRYWEERAEQEYNRNIRTKHPCSMVMFDIDHFKRINDNYGHLAGDDVIRQTAATLKSTMRNTDISGRYGGEEFVVILVDTAPENAFVFCERLRKNIESLNIKWESETIKYTISLGVCELYDCFPNYQSWLEQADQALYQSKETGRNKTTIMQYDNIKIVD
ncbi:diguanylate cyclase [Celerinatantimonas sp. YJH-8]|uniref:sensor domain-containing diguanylate cyclase n=1 Tax=Celerinatantimonas sp. YJH-8 TaxID=3228714 RepID=UPI0038C3FF34